MSIDHDRARSRRVPSGADPGPSRAGAGPTTAQLPVQRKPTPGGRPGALPFLEVQLASDAARDAAPRDAAADPDAVAATAAAGFAGPGQALPHGAQIQAAFGHHDVGGVTAHVGGAAADASATLGAHGYASGSQVAFAAAPDLHLAAHEAAHVVQQRAGVHLASAVGQAGDAYERHADRVADAVVAGAAAAPILDELVGGGSAGPAVQRQEAGTFGGVFDPLETAKTSSFEVAEIFFKYAKLQDRVEVIKARLGGERAALLRGIPGEDMLQVLRFLPVKLKAALIVDDDGLADRLPAELIADILTEHPPRSYVLQPKLTLVQMLAVFPVLSDDRQAPLLLANERHATPIFNALEDFEVAPLLRGLHHLPVVARRIVENLPGHLRDRVRRAIADEPALADLMPADTSTDADLAASQTNPDKAWIWDASRPDHGSKHVLPSSEWAEQPAYMRVAYFVMATIDKRVAYLDAEPESKGRLLRELDPVARVDTVLAYVRKHPKRRGLLGDLKAADMIVALESGLNPGDAAALYLASSDQEMQAIAPMLTPMHVAAILSVDDIEHVWLKVWTWVPTELFRAAFLRMDQDRLENLLFHAGDSGERMRALLPAGHPLAKGDRGT